MRTILLRGLLLSCLISPVSFAGQIFSIGVKGGVPFTDAFSNSSSKNYIVGPMVELHLPLGLSVEADGLYRPLNFTAIGFNENYSSWEFPILAKYRFATPLLKPFVDAGPSFRTVGGSLGNSPSNTGFAAGAGLELRLARFRLGPEIRYTHWGSDSSNAVLAGFSSNQNQVEFLVGLSF